MICAGDLVNLAIDAALQRLAEAPIGTSGQVALSILTLVVGLLNEEQSGPLVFHAQLVAHLRPKHVALGIVHVLIEHGYDEPLADL
jgi:hypothetical protein